MSKVAGQSLDCYCVCSELLSASIADALQFVNILVSGIFHGHFAQRLAVNKPCLQIVRRLLWKQTTTHSIRNNNPIFDREEPLVKQIRPTVYRQVYNAVIRFQHPLAAPPRLASLANRVTHAVNLVGGLIQTKTNLRPWKIENCMLTM